MARNARRTTILIALTLASAAACSPGPVGGPPLQPFSAEAEVRLAIPGATNAGAGVAMAGGRVVATWAATAGEETNVYAAASADGGRTFGAPVRVNDVAGDARQGGEQAPRVAMARDVVVGWVSRLGGQAGIRVARSADSGQTWSAAKPLHAPGLAGIRGWTSLAIDRDEAAHAAWLDTRADAARRVAGVTTATGAQHDHHGPTEQDLFHARWLPDGSIIETTVASNVCFCCKTAVAAAPDGATYVAWRHLYATNLRDIAVARSDDGRAFGAPVRVSEDRWQIDGCPEDGPSMAVDEGGVVHVAWPTMVQGDSPGKGVFYAFSTDRGATFAPRVRIDEARSGEHAGHPQLAVAGRRVFVVWDESADAGFRVRLRDVREGVPGAIQAVDDNGSSTYPAVAVTADGVVAAWTRRSAGQSEIVVRRLEK